MQARDHQEICSPPGQASAGRQHQCCQGVQPFSCLILPRRAVWYPFLIPVKPSRLCSACTVLAAITGHCSAGCCACIQFCKPLSQLRPCQCRSAILADGHSCLHATLAHAKADSLRYGYPDCCEAHTCMHLQAEYTDGILTIIIMRDTVSPALAACLWRTVLVL